jgi:hypothetical protein
MKLVKYFMDTNFTLYIKKGNMILGWVEGSLEVQISTLISKKLLQIHMPTYNSVPRVSYPTSTWKKKN